jgi:hypothetical protein
VFDNGKAYKREEAMEHLMGLFFNKDFSGIAKATNMEPSRVFLIIEQGNDPLEKNSRGACENIGIDLPIRGINPKQGYKLGRVLIPSKIKRLYRQEKRVRLKSNRKAERIHKLKYRLRVSDGVDGEVLNATMFPYLE